MFVPTYTEIESGVYPIPFTFEKHSIEEVLSGLIRFSELKFSLTKSKKLYVQILDSYEPKLFLSRGGASSVDPLLSIHGKIRQKINNVNFKISTLFF